MLMQVRERKGETGERERERGKDIGERERERERECLVIKLTKPLHR